MEERSRQKLINDFFQVSEGKEKENACKVRRQRPACEQHVDSAGLYVKKQRNYVKDEAAQYTLDAGQKNIGTQFCKDCNMVYDCDSVTDCNLHTEYHDRFIKRDWFRVKYSQVDAWRKQNFYVVVDGGYLFSLKMTTKSSLKQRLEEVISKCVNVELGFPPDLNTIWKNDETQLWGFVASSSKLKFPFIGAVVLVEGLNEVFTYTDGPESSSTKKRYRGWFMGVNRIWVHHSLRRTGVATRMLDEIRYNMRSGCVIPRTRIAFSELTDDGLAFAKTFCTNGQILMFSVMPSKR